MQTPTNCCTKKCLRIITPAMVYQARYKYWIKSRREQVDWIYDKLAESEQIDRKSYFPINSGKKICSPMFIKYYNINKTFYYKCLHKYREGALASGSRGKRTKSDAYFIAVDWLQDYAKYRGDRMPDTLTVKLSYGTRKRLVWEECKKELEEKFLPVLSKSHFLSTWNEELSHIQIKKVRHFFFFL